MFCITLCVGVCVCLCTYPCVCVWVSVCVNQSPPTYFDAGLNDAHQHAAHRVFGHGEVVLTLLEDRGRDHACHHTDVNPRVDGGHQSAAILRRDRHGDDGVGLAVERSGQGDHACDINSRG